MIINDYELTKWAMNGGLDPFNYDCVNPASIDLRWSGRFRAPVGFAVEAWSEVCELDQLVLTSNKLMLLDTLEVVTMPPDHCGMIALKSSMGRMGLEHMHAGFIDPGFRGTITLEMCVVSPWKVTLVKGQRIVQLMLMKMSSPPIHLYSGRYQGDMQPMPHKGG